MEFERTTSWTICDIFSTAISFFTSLGHRISPVLADDIVTGEKLPEESLERRVYEIEVGRIASEELFYVDPKGFADSNDCAFDRNDFNAFSNFTRDMDIEIINGIELREHDYTHLEQYSQEIYPPELQRRNLESRECTQSGNRRSFEYRDSHVDNTKNLSVPCVINELKYICKERKQECKNRKECRRIYVYGTEYILDNSHENVTNPVLESDHSALAQESQYETEIISSISTLVELKMDESQIGFPNYEEFKAFLDNQSKKIITESVGFEMQNISNHDLERIAPSNDFQSSFHDSNTINFSEESNIKDSRLPKSKVRSNFKHQMKMKQLEEINERWKKKRENVIQEKLLKLPSLKKTEKLENKSLNNEGKTTECSTVLDERTLVHSNEGTGSQVLSMSKTEEVSNVNDEN